MIAGKVPRHIVLCVCCTTIAVCATCRSNPPSGTGSMPALEVLTCNGPICRLELDEPVPNYDACLTWSGFEGYGAGGQANYIWNGVTVGVGEAGLSEVLRKVREMRRGAVILAFPRYDLDWQLASSERARVYPWNNFLDGLEAALQSSGTRLVLSPRDATGHVLEICKPPDSSNIASEAQPR